MRSVSSSGEDPIILPIIVNTANITFSRDSPQMTLPLESTMTIENVNNRLEETVITCIGLNSSSVSSAVLMKTMHIIDIDRGMNTIKLAIFILSLKGIVSIHKD